MHNNKLNYKIINITALMLLLYITFSNIGLWWGLFVKCISVLAPFIVSFAFAYAFTPLVRWLNKKGLSKGFSIVIVLLGIILLVAGILAITLPLIYEQLSLLVKMIVEVMNNFKATGGITAYSSSDIRLKQNLHKLNYLNIIKAMGGSYGFTWIKDNKHSIGWIAQHVLNNPYMSDIVETDENGYYKINYWSPKLIATAFGAIEQIDDEVSKLKARVTYLESEVERLTNDNRKLEATNNKLLISK